METGAAAPICPFCVRFRYTIPMRVCLRTSKFLLLLSILCVTLALGAFADEGPLDTAKPTGITAEEIIQRFAAKEKEFKDARDQYTFRQSVTVQTVDGDTVTGEYREVFDVQFDDRGKHLENVVFAPQSSLENGGISMSPEDIDDIRHKLPFVLTSEDVGEYDVLYVGQQQEDELHCYVFDIAPKQIQGKKRYFQGRIWVDDKDYQIVKTFGKTVPETRVKKNGKGNENLFPKFTTWREQIDGKYWFPTYTKADDILHFHTGDIHIREIVKYTDYQRFGSNVKITYEGKEVQKDQNGQEKPADSKSEEKPKE
jgi:outer membrane lipoprotein-sorting protein